MKKLWGFICICAFVSTIGNSTSIKPHINDFLLNHFSQKTEAVIVDELFNYHHHSYIYLFKVDGKKYSHEIADSTLKLGEKIEVEYYKFNPRINKILHFKYHS